MCSQVTSVGILGIPLVSGVCSKSGLWRNLPFNLWGLCSLWVVSELNCRTSYYCRTVDIRELFKRRVNVYECVCTSA